MSNEILRILPNCSDKSMINHIANNKFSYTDKTGITIIYLVYKSYTAYKKDLREIPHRLIKSNSFLYRRNNIITKKPQLLVLSFPTSSWGFYHSFMRLSSPLLLRNYPNTFAFIPSPAQPLIFETVAFMLVFNTICPTLPIYQSPIYCTTDLP